MAVSPLQDFVSAVLSGQSSPLSATTRAPASSAIPTVPATTAQPSVVAPSPQLLETSNLSSASANLAQLGSLLQVAQDGTGQVADILQQINSLAQQAEDGTDVPSSQFQQLTTQLNLIVGNTQFGGKPLLTGSFSAVASDSQEGSTTTLSLPNLTSQGLFGGALPSNPADIIAVVTAAQSVVSGTTASIASVEGQLDFANASVDSALANNDASTATLSEDDLAGESNLLSDLLSSPSASAQAQTGNLSDAVMSLLQG